MMRQFRNFRWHSSRKHAGVLLVALLVFQFALRGADQPGPPPSSNESSDVPDSKVDPIILPAQKQGVKWKPLLLQSLNFLLLENGFRYATEQATRDPGLPYFRGYIDAVGNLHGWADGDPFYVNYVGHPMQGAVSGFIWVHNDPQYANVEFGRDSRYWKGRLRAGAFAWAYSEWTEIGPFISEAAIGNVQAFFPQQGFVDHVATPAIGLGWMIAEDAMDRYLVEFVERKTDNRYVRLLVRSGANPARTLANVLEGQLPWARERDHGGYPALFHPVRKPSEDTTSRSQKSVAPSQFAANTFFFHRPRANVWAEEPRPHSGSRRPCRWFWT